MFPDFYSFLKKYINFTIKLNFKKIEYFFTFLFFFISYKMASVQPEIKSINLGDFEKYISKETDQEKIKEETENYHKKQELINNQAKNFGVYLHYADTSKFKNSFYLKQFKTYNDFVIT